MARAVLLLQLRAPPLALGRTCDGCRPRPGVRHLPAAARGAFPLARPVDHCPLLDHGAGAPSRVPGSHAAATACRRVCAPHSGAAWMNLITAGALRLPGAAAGQLGVWLRTRPVM